MASRFHELLGQVEDAARAAGEKLREELSRPGGPRGRGDHAEVDEEVERWLRTRLLELHEAGFLGEETGALGSASADTWVVDPNDGTRYFLEGHRGASVSIGLLRGGVPVLGVVYAYAAPDHAGDLVSWAEGVGPVRRNGRPVEAARRTSLDAQTVVVVSAAAEDAVETNLELLAPARFLCSPGIAYRLALVAAGDADVAVSVPGAQAWDVAGGHALLRGAGCALLDGEGRPWSYGRDGRAPRSACFGGLEPLAREVQRREWAAVLHPRRPRGSSPQRHEGPPGFPRIRPEVGRHERDPGRLARAQGVLLGQLAGDALGSLVEFRDPEFIAANFPSGVRALVDGGTWQTLAGQPTDDSEMALMLARSLVEACHYDPDAAMAAYVHWYRSRPFDIGGTTTRALSAAERASERAASAAEAGADEGSQANGSLMRASPLGIFFAGQPARAAEAARRDSGLTHPHAVCRESCAALTAAIAAGIDGAPPVEMWKVAAATAKAPEVCDRLERARRESTPASTDKAGWVLIALQNAFHALLNAASFEEGVVSVVERGGDTDTNGAIAGALLGAAHGREAIPAQWRRMVLTCRPVAAAGARHPRPSEFWPVDALELAERLLVVGGSAGVKRQARRPRAPQKGTRGRRKT